MNFVYYFLLFKNYEIMTIENEKNWKIELKIVSEKKITELLKEKIVCELKKNETATSVE